MSFAGFIFIISVFSAAYFIWAAIREKFFY